MLLGVPLKEVIQHTDVGRRLRRSSPSEQKQALSTDHGTLYHHYLEIGVQLADPTSTAAPTRGFRLSQWDSEGQRESESSTSESHFSDECETLHLDFVHNDVIPASDFWPESATKQASSSLYTLQGSAEA